MASVTGTPVVVTDAGAVLADTHTASAAGLDLIFIVSERGISGTSPTVLTYGGIDVIDALDADPDTGPITALAQIAAASRAHRAYRLSKAKHPGTGTHAVACSWAGTDNIGIAIIEIASTGAISIADTNFNSSGDDVTITALDGDLTISCAQGNSATPNFSPSSGQTEILETVWYSNTGHVVGVQTGAQSASNWTSAGSTCASAFVIHEESSGLDEIELGGEALGGGQVTSSAAALVTMAGALMGGARVVGSLEPRISAEASARGAARVPAAATPSLVADAAEMRGAGQASSDATPSLVALASSVGGSRVTVAAVPSVTLAGDAQGAGRVSSEAPPIVLEGVARGAGRVMGSVSVLATAAGSTRGAARASAGAVVTSLASGAARAAGRILGALRVLVGLGGEARAAGRATGGEGAIEYAPSPATRTRLAARGALRSRVAARTRRRTRHAAGPLARLKVLR